MKNLAFAVLALSTLLPGQSLAMDCANVPSCLDYGYKYSSCPGDFMACPFDTSFKQCDQEANDSDYKFTLETTFTSGWTQQNTKGSNFDGVFIVGAGTGMYCGVANNKKEDATMPKHRHSFNPGKQYISCNNSINFGWQNNNYIQTPMKESNYPISFTVEANTPSAGMPCNADCGNEAFAPVYKSVNFALLPRYNPPTNINTQASISSSQPKCEDLGYIDTVSNCPGEYLRCPFDTTKVMCDMEAKAGEIKYSLQEGDHNGWLLANGRTLAGTPYGNSELHQVLKDTGASNYDALPDYQGMFLRTIDNTYTTTNPTYYTSYKGGCSSSHNHSILTSDYYYTYPQIGNYYGSLQGYGSSKIITYTPNTMTPYSGWTTGATCTATNCSIGENRPFNYAANIFIYTGKLNQGAPK